MDVKSISMNLSQKINLGNFQTKAISIGVAAELDESDDLTECKAELSAKINQLLEEEIIREKQLLLVASRR